MSGGAEVPCFVLIILSLFVSQSPGRPASWEAVFYQRPAVQSEEQINIKIFSLVSSVSTHQGQAQRQGQPLNRYRYLHMYIVVVDMYMLYIYILGPTLSIIIWSNKS